MVHRASRRPSWHLGVQGDGALLYKNAEGAQGACVGASFGLEKRVRVGEPCKLIESKFVLIESLLRVYLMTRPSQHDMRCYR